MSRPPRNRLEGAATERVAFRLTQCQRDRLDALVAYLRSKRPRAGVSDVLAALLEAELDAFAAGGGVLRAISSPPCVPTPGGAVAEPPPAPPSPASAPLPAPPPPAAPSDPFADILAGLR